MMMSEAYRYEDVKTLLDRDLKEMGVDRDREPRTSRVRPTVSVIDRVGMVLIPLIAGIALVA